MILPVLLAIGITGCSNSKKESQKNENNTTGVVKSVQKKPIATEIKLHSVNTKEIVFIKSDKTLKLKENNDKIILLNFFATWCPPCKAEIPHLINLQKKYHDKLKIISVLLEDDKPDSEIQSFIDYNHINYTITNDTNNFKLSNLLGGIQSIPFMILYDKQGRVITHYIGIIPEEMIDSDIKKAITK
jgi:thiol-disulfide isomerase/thioredoxin